MRFPSPAVLLADFAGCLRFFSRLPVPALSAADDPVAAPVFARAAALVPLAGIVVALPAAAAAGLAVAAGLPPTVIGAIAVLVGALVTGALHEDGLADSADGLFGASERTRRLDIMRDSRIGSFGALALLTVGMIRIGAIGALAAAGPLPLAGAMLAAAAASRAAMTLAWAVLPPARMDGLSAAAGRPSAPAAAVAAILGLLASMLATTAAGPGGVAIGLAAGTVAASIVARAAWRRVGGQTGDVLGAVQQTAEAALLAGFLV